jgi:endonuclease/exonuclease/phosphatase family metal-dependent hydrolase
MKKHIAKKSQWKNDFGLIKGCRLRHVSWTKSDKLYIGTWNVMTLLRPGTMQELAEEIAKTQLERVALQEIRWPGKGQIYKKDYILYYSASKEKTGQAGTGFLSMKKVQKHIISYESHNERLCKLRVKGKYNNITLISAYAPTEDKTEETKEQFYNNLQSIVDKVPKSDITIILGDVNAKLGKEPAYNKITGKHTHHEVTNRNAELLWDFAATNNMIVMSTQFQHKQIHKGTWISPDQNTINQIDHVLININKEEVTEDVRSLRGPNIDSDHFLLKATLKQKLLKIYKRKSAQTTKWNETNMQNPSKLIKYRTSLHNKLKAIPDTTNVEEEWEGMKEAITEAANEVIQTQNRTTRNEWRDEECRQCIKRKNTARNKWLQQKTRASQESYIKRRKEANVLFRQKKKAWINNHRLQIEQNWKRNKIRKVFQEIKTFKPSK